ncbi:MAG: membrane protein required for colicin V production [Candidatus Latescibacterota bacterium]|jgi:membrane protein required for colicin V production
MNIVDIVLALGLFWTARKGWQIGLVQTLLSLLSIVLAYGFALAYGENAARQLLDTTEELDGGTALLGFLAIFVVVLIACYFIGRTLHKVLQASPLGIVDSVGGGALGLAKGLLILGLLTVFFKQYPIHSRVPTLIEQSALGTPVQDAALVIANVVKTIFPKTKNFLESMGVKGDKAPPLVDKLNKSAGEARKRIDELIDESREKLGK